MNPDALLEQFPTAIVTPETVRLSGVRLEGGLTFEGSRNSISLSDIAGVGDLCIRDSRIGLLNLTDLSLEGTITFQNVTVDKLSIRKAYCAGTLLVAGSRCETLELHDVGDVCVINTPVYGEAMLSKMRGNVSLKYAQMGQVTLREILDAELIELQELSCTGTLRVDDVACRGIEIRDSELKRLVIANALTASSPGVCIKDTVVTGDVTLDAVETAGVCVARFDASQFGGTMRFRHLKTNDVEDGPCVELDACRLGGSLAVRENDAVSRRHILLRDTGVGGELRLQRIKDGTPATPNESSTAGDGREDVRGTHIALEGSSSISTVYVALGTRPLGVRGIRDLATTTFGVANYQALMIIRDALHAQGRHNEEDLAYYAAQNARTHAGVRGRIGAGALRWLFGWGVRPYAPIIALTVAVILNGLGYYAYHAIARHGGWGPRAALDSANLSAQLFVGLSPTIRWSPHGLLYNLDTALAAATGILFTTVAIGILIRRLVR